MENHEKGHHHKETLGGKRIVSAVIVLLLVGGASFWGGMKYQGNKNTAAKAGYGAGFPGGSGRAGGRGAAGGFVTGDILSKDASSITVKMRDGSSKIVLIPGSAAILKSTTGTTTDLAIGQSVTVIGSPNSDGSLNAQTVQIRPAGMGPQGPGR